MSAVKKHKKACIILITALAVCCAAALYCLKTSNSRTAVKFREYAGGILHTLSFPNRPDPREGMNITKETLYVNNKAASKASYQSGKDNKLVMETPEGMRLFDYTAGYYVDLPPETVFDFSKSPKFTAFGGEGFSGVISREWSVGDDVSAYADYYFNRFILNERFQAENQIRLIENTKSGNMEKITVSAENFEKGYDMYTYVIFKTGSRFFFRVMLKYNSGDTQIEDVIQRITNSFYYFKPEGKAVYDLDLYPAIPGNWSDETRALYNYFNESDDVKWGIFTEDIYSEGIGKKIPALEESLDYKFEIVLSYVHLTEEFPLDFMQKCYDEGRVAELTYQMTMCNNEDLYARSPVIDLYRGLGYERIRAFARKAKEFGHPFLFRLNNEMNSDWTSYGGVNNLLDPEIFIESWRIVYQIFQEVGVDNAIWIFNPNDRDCPPNNWNSYIAYYPGNEYVHMIGVTGYNNGSYYRDVTGESWRGFELIYDTITEEYGGVFDSFPWIITEFSSSSIGGDKVKWIRGMFNALKKYPNIKAAVWFSYADYDFRPGYEGNVARPYWLDETPETLEAFKKGLHKK